MRKIDSDMLQAVISGKNWAKANTSVFYISASESGNPFGARSEIYLHGNHIANYWHESKEVEINTRILTRWPTPTTKNRLRALGVNLTTKKGRLFIDGVEVTA